MSSKGKSSVTLRELKNNSKDYNIELIIDISYDLDGKLKIKTKKLARLVLETLYGSYIHSNIIEIVEFHINKELLREDFDSDKNKDRKSGSYNKRKRDFIRKSMV